MIPPLFSKPKPSAPLAPIVAIVLALAGGPSAARANNSDDFNDNAKDPAKWGADTTLRQGVFTERSQRLEYTVASGTLEDDVWRPWILTRFPVDADWTVQCDLKNSSTPTTAFQVNSIGVLVASTHTNSPEVYAELYSSALGGLPSRYGFYAELTDENEQSFPVDRGATGGWTNGAVRLAYAGATRILQISYDSNLADGYQWQPLARFGLGGSGGTNGDANWALSGLDQFAVSVYGYSVGMTIGPGQMAVDNFRETGGVEPSDRPWPDPLGHYVFRFPMENPLVTRMANLTGTYEGISPTRTQRPYSIDVAQDESGKIVAMGRIEGIVDRNGNPELTGASGSVRTVNGEPQVAVKGTFAGARDGVTASIKGAASVPVELVDIGGGTNEIRGTGSYSSKVGGVPFSGRNLPLGIPAPAGATNNLKQEWSFELNLARKLIGTKQRTVGSARLTLPNGDTVAFKERAVRHSPTRGYTLSFAGGTNLTANPPRLDRRSSVAIQGLTFVQESETWRPTGGRILYKFLGQRGTANLLDFQRE